MTPFTFSLWKIFLVVAAFAVYFAALASQGGLGVFLAIVFGSSAGGVIILSRRSNLKQILITVVCSIGGAVVGFLLIMNPWHQANWVRWSFTPDALFSLVLGAIVGGIVGWMINMWRHTTWY